MELVLPAGTDRVQVLVRTACAHSDEPLDQRTLTHDGYGLCLSSRRLWQNIVRGLFVDFNEPIYQAGSPAAVQTCLGLFEPKRIAVRPELTIHHSLEGLPDGWFESRQAAGRTRLQIMRELRSNTKIQGRPQIVQEALQLSVYLNTLATSNGCLIAVTDEPAITLALMNLVTDEPLAFAPGEGTILCRRADGDPIGVVNVTIGQPVSTH